MGARAPGPGDAGARAPGLGAASQCHGEGRTPARRRRGSGEATAGQQALGEAVAGESSSRGAGRAAVREVSAGGGWPARWQVQRPE